MVEVSNQRNGTRQDLISQLLGKRQSSSLANNKSKPDVYQPKGREIHDTVEISGGSKIVNLSRGHDLASEIRADKNADTLDQRLRQGQSDIERIGKLFREVFSSLNSIFRRGRT